MSATSPSSPRVPIWVQVLIAFFIAFDVAAAWQWFGGAYASEFGGREEAEHFLAAVSKTPGAVSADRAPLFCGLLAAWMSAFGTGRLPALLFMALLGAANATVILAIVRRENGAWAASAAALLWLCAPAVRAANATLLPETLAALALTLGIIAWQRLLVRPSWRNAGAAALPGLAAVFAGVPVFSLAVAAVLVSLVDGWLRSLRQHAVWIAIAMVAGPAVWWLRRGTAVGFEFDPSSALPVLTPAASILGVAATGFALAGLATRVRSAAGDESTWVANVAVVLGVLANAAVAPGKFEIASLIAGTPSLAMLAAGGAVALSRVPGSRQLPECERNRRTALWVLLLLLLVLPWSITAPQPKEWRGFEAIAEMLIGENDGGTRVLVVSDRQGENMLLTELAMKDPEGRIAVERGSETLTQPGETGPRGKRPERFIEDEHLLSHLASGRIQYVVVDPTVSYEGHADYQDQARRVIEQNAGIFWPVFDSPMTRNAELQIHPLRVFRVRRSGSSPE